MTIVLDIGYFYPLLSCLSWASYICVPVCKQCLVAVGILPGVCACSLPEVSFHCSSMGQGHHKLNGDICVVVSYVPTTSCKFVLRKSDTGLKVQRETYSFREPNIWAYGLEKPLFWANPELLHTVNFKKKRDFMGKVMFMFISPTPTWEEPLEWNLQWEYKSQSNM